MVGVGLDGGGCGEDQDVGVFENLRGCGRNRGALRFAQNDGSFILGDGVGSGLDYAENRDGGGFGLYLGEGEGRGGVAGYDEDVGALIEEETGAGDGVAGDGLAGFGAVGETGGVTEVDVVGVGDQGQEGA